MDHNAAMYVAKYAAKTDEQRRILEALQHRDHLRILAGVELSGVEACAMMLSGAVHMECSHEKMVVTGHLKYEFAVFFG